MYECDIICDVFMSLHLTKVSYADSVDGMKLHNRADQMFQIN